MDVNFRFLAMRVATGVEAAKKKTKKTKTKKPTRTLKPKKLIEPVDDSIIIDDSITEDMLQSKTEYSCQLQISIIADFEGDVNKNQLLKKLKNEIINAIKSGVAITAREYNLEATNITVQPIEVECAVNSIE